MPSKARNFFGRLVDMVLPGQNYNPQTGQYSNVGSGLAKLGMTALGGPGAGFLANKLFNNNTPNAYGIDRAQYGIDVPGVEVPDVQMDYGKGAATNPMPGQVFAQRGPTGYQGGTHGLMGTNGARHYGATSYANDYWGDAAASFGVGAGNSGWANRQSGADIYGNKYQQ